MSPCCPTPLVLSNLPRHVTFMRRERWGPKPRRRLGQADGKNWGISTPHALLSTTACSRAWRLRLLLGAARVHRVFAGASTNNRLSTRRRVKEVRERGDHPRSDSFYTAQKVAVPLWLLAAVATPFVVYSRLRRKRSSDER